MTKQNIAFNERLLEHQKRVMELQKRHFENKKINQKLVEAANQQEMHVYVPQSLRMTSPSTDITRSVFREPKQLAEISRSRQILGSYADPLSFSQEDGSYDVSLSISAIPPQNEDQERNGCQEFLDETVETTDRVLSEYTDEINTNSKPLNGETEKKETVTQTINVKEQEVATQTSFTEVPKKDIIHIENNTGLKKFEIIENKKEELRQKYPNIFDGVQSKDTSTILDRMFTAEENKSFDNNSTDVNFLHVNKTLLNSTSGSPSQQRVNKESYMQHDLSTSNITWPSLANSSVEIRDFEKRNSELNTIHQRRYELQTFTASSHQPSRDTDSQSRASYLSKNKEEFADTFSGGLLNEPSKKTLPTVSAILAELKNLQGNIVSSRQFNDSDTVENEVIEMPLVSESIIDSPNVSVPALSESKNKKNIQPIDVDSVVEKPENHLKYLGKNPLPSSSTRFVRVSEHPHVSPIKEVDEFTTNFKQNSKCIIFSYYTSILQCIKCFIPNARRYLNSPKKKYKYKLLLVETPAKQAEHST